MTKKKDSFALEGCIVGLMIIAIIMVCIGILGALVFVMFAAANAGAS